MGLQIAERKRKENISEYLIHMYQSEDLIRAYEFNISEIEKYVVSHLPLDDDEKTNTIKWYEGMIDSMEKENLKEKGHTQQLDKLVKSLEDLHQSLINKNDAYTEIYEKAKSHLESFRSQAGDELISDIQLCLNAVYGLLILRLNNRPIADEQMESVDVFGALLSYLSYIFRQQESLSEN